MLQALAGVLVIVVNCVRIVLKLFTFTEKAQENEVPGSIRKSEKMLVCRHFSGKCEDDYRK